jgi:hypothetical protein
MLTGEKPTRAGFTMRYKVITKRLCLPPVTIFAAGRRMAMRAAGPEIFLRAP